MFIPRTVVAVAQLSRLSWIFVNCQLIWRGVFCQSAIKSAQLDTELLLHNMLAERDVPWNESISTCNA